MSNYVICSDSKVQEPVITLPTILYLALDPLLILPVYTHESEPLIQ